MSTRIFQIIFTKITVKLCFRQGASLLNPSALEDGGHRESGQVSNSAM